MNVLNLVPFGLGCQSVHLVNMGFFPDEGGGEGGQKSAVVAALDGCGHLVRRAGPRSGMRTQQPVGAEFADPGAEFAFSVDHREVARRGRL